MTDQHTPGPWRVEATAYRNQPHIVNEDGAFVADTDAHNARLIAAAPELLATLLNTTDALEQLKRGGNFKPWSDYTPHVRDLIANARAAIAKATGGQS